MKLCRILLAIVGLGANPAFAQAEYQECLDKADIQPSAALEDAEAWVAKGGGFPAEHCRAMALMQLGQFKRAATALRKLSLDAAKADMAPAIRRELWAQTLKVALQDQAAKPALEAAEQALKLAPDQPEIRLLSARAHDLGHDLAAARRDLDQALRLDPTLIDAWILRASVRRRTKDLKGADEDIETALALNPDRADARKERELLQTESGRKSASH